MPATEIDGRFFPDLEKYKVVVGTAATYHFRFAEPFGWAVFTINDATGEFQIQSDWGQWQHRWGVDNLGGDKENPFVQKMPLTYFLAVRPDPSYVVMKFAYNKPRDFKEQFSDTQTLKTWRERILSQRTIDHPTTREFLEKVGITFDEDWSDHTLTKENAAELWDQAGQWCDCCGRSETFVVYAVTQMEFDYPELHEWLNQADFVHEQIEYNPSWEYTFLMDRLLPFFFEYLRNNVLNINEGEPHAP